MDSDDDEYFGDEGTNEAVTSGNDLDPLEQIQMQSNDTIDDSSVHSPPESDITPTSCDHQTDLQSDATSCSPSQLTEF